MDIPAHLDRFLAEQARVRPRDGIVVAFSGGVDSTVLLWGLARIRDRLGLRLIAAHLDHRCDAGSPGRRAEAARLAADIGIAFEHGRADERPGGSRDGLEAGLRRQRYRFLGRVRQCHDCRFVATAHHRDDQAETVLLRMQFGSGPLGLAGIRDRDGPYLRPLLDVARPELVAAAQAAGLRWIEDPTNRDLARPRNRLRHATLPRLELDAGDLTLRLDRLATAAARARRVVRRRLSDALEPIVAPAGVSVALPALSHLPEALLGPAMGLLQQLAGSEYPPPARAVEELRRQLGAGHGIGCDCGAFWRWEGREGRLHIRRSRTKGPVFPYTLKLRGGGAPAPANGPGASLSRIFSKPPVLSCR